MEIVNTKENNSTGLVEFSYGGHGSYQRLIIRPECGCDVVVDNTTNPLLNDFLNYLSKIELNVDKPGVYDVEFFFLNEVVRDYIAVEDNKLVASDILNTFKNEYVFLDDLYYIDKTNSGENFLYLDRLIDNVDKIWTVDVYKTTFTYLSPVKEKLVNAVTSIKDNTDLSDVSSAVNTIRLIELACDGDRKKTLFKMLSKCWMS